MKHGELSISTLKPYHVAGKYKQDNLGVAFEARFQGAQMSINILDLQGKELLIAHENNGMIEQSILGGRMTIKMPKLILAEDMSESELAKLTEQHIANIKIQGEENSFTELQELPEYALLPIISKLLGINGVTGNRFPATLSLHLLALGAFNFQQINGEEHPTDEGHPDVVYRIKHPFQDRLLADLIFDFIDDDIIPCNPLENEIKMYPPGYDEPWYGGCNSTTGCKKSKCKCADNKPNRDEDCVGMCGKGCCCWCWVCGDCCFHRGCFVHDIACGGCHDSFGLNVAACTVCYSPIAGIGFIC